MIESFLISALAGLFVDGIESCCSYYTRRKNNSQTNEDRIANKYFIAFKNSLKDIYDNTVTEEEFFRLVAVRVKSNKDLGLKFTQMDLREVFTEIIHENGLEECEDLFDLFIESFFCEISKDQELTNFLLLNDYKKEMQLLNTSEKQEEYEYTILMETINGYTKSITDVYKELDFIDNLLYPYFLMMYNQGCSEKVINMGYWLTNVYDLTSKYDKSVKIAEMLLSEKPSELTMSCIQKRIGCAYSISISKTDNINEKLRRMEKARNEFENCRLYIDKWQRIEKDNYRIFFIQALYYSDYAAFLTNELDWSLKNGDIDEETYNRRIEDAIKYHEETLDARNRIVELKGVIAVEKYQDNQFRICKTLSNIGGLYYRIKKYDKAIFFQQKAIDGLTSDDTSFENLMYLYMSGAYIGKWNEEKKVDIEKAVELIEMLNRAAKYYNGEDSVRYSEAVSKRDVIRRMIEESPKD